MQTPHGGRGPNEKWRGPLPASSRGMKRERKKKEGRKEGREKERKRGGGPYPLLLEEGLRLRVRARLHLELLPKVVDLLLQTCARIITPAEVWPSIKNQNKSAPGDAR